MSVKFESFGENSEVVAYTVQNGDTVAAIAMRHGMTLKQLQSLNNVYGSNLYLGQVLWVKSRASEDANSVPTAACTQKESKPISPCRDSLLDGFFWSPVILRRKQLQVSGTVEINRHYLEFIPDKFHSTAVESSKDCLNSKISIVVLGAYKFRIDWCDVVNILKHDSVKVKNEDTEDKKADLDLYLEILWNNHDGLCLGDPQSLCLYLTLRDSLDGMHDSAVKALSVRRERSSFCSSRKDIRVARSLTSGAIVSGLLSCSPSISRFRASDLSYGDVPDSFVDEEDNHIVPADVLLHSMLIHQSYLCGEITKEEREILMDKNEEMHKRNASLEESISSTDDDTQKSDEVITPTKEHAEAREKVTSRLRCPPHWVDSIKCSKIISDDTVLCNLRSKLPERLRPFLWNVTFDFDSQGVSLRNFYSHVSGFSDSLLIIQTCKGNIFGSFTTEEWVMSRPREYYGSGESFLFCVEKMNIKMYPWSGANHCIQNSSSTHLGVGGGMHGFAFCLDEDLNQGSASPSETFGLAKPIIPETQFKVAKLELIIFWPDFRRKPSSAEAPKFGSSRSFFSPKSYG